VVVAAVALFFAPAFTGGRQFLYRDTGRTYYPEKRWIAEELRRGHLPEWNPYAGLGTPVVAGAIASVQHPLNAIFLVLPFDDAFRLWIVLCYVMAGLGVLAWGRALGCGPGGAATAALAFTLSGFLVSSSDNLIHLATMAGAPWLLAAARVHALRGGRLRLAGVLAASFLCAAGGEVLDWGLAVVIAAVQASLPGDGSPPRLRAARAVAGLGAALAGAAPVILPFVAFLPESSRSGALALEEARRWNLHPVRVAELVIPHLARGVHGQIRNDPYVLLTGDPMPTPWISSLYLGAPVLALALLGAGRSRAARVLVAGAVVLAWISMGHHAGFAWFASRLPVLSGVRYFERLAGWPTLLLAVAAAYGVQRLRVDRGAGRRLAWVAGGAGAILLLGRIGAGALEQRIVAAASQGQLEGARALGSNVADGMASSGLALAGLALMAALAASGRLVRHLSTLLVALVALDLAGVNARAYVLSPVGAIYPDDAAAAPLPARAAAAGEVGRVSAPYALDRERWPELLPYESGWRWGARTLAPSFHLAWRVPSFDVYAGVSPGRLKRFTGRLGVPGYVVPAGLVGLGAVAVPHRVERAAELRVPPPWRVVAEDPELPAWLVALPHRPRAYVAGEIIATDAEGALDFLSRVVPERERRTALEGRVPPGYRPPRAAARVAADEGERVTVAVESDGPALLVLNDQLLGGWTAEVDGRRVPISAANYLVRGVWVEAGAHEVVFQYRTPLWRAGWLVLVAALLGLLVPWPARRRRGSQLQPRAPPAPP
jgi:hypothetical protein